MLLLSFTVFWAAFLNFHLELGPENLVARHGSIHKGKRRWGSRKAGASMSFSPSLPLATVFLFYLHHIFEVVVSKKFGNLPSNPATHRGKSKLKHRRMKWLFKLRTQPASQSLLRALPWRPWPLRGDTAHSVIIYGSWHDVFGDYRWELPCWNPLWKPLLPAGTEGVITSDWCLVTEPDGFVIQRILVLQRCLGCEHYLRRPDRSEYP